MLTIAFTTPKKFYPTSFLIKYFEKTEFSHCVLIFTDKNRREFVYEAGYRGVSFSSGPFFSKNNRIIEAYSLDCDNSKKDSLLDFIYENIGKNYGYLTVFGHLVQRFAWKLGESGLGKGLLSRFPLLFTDGSKSYFCSELLGDLLRRVYNLDIPNLEMHGPKMLRDLVVDHIKEYGHG